jgi:hypothetical protein
MNNYIEVSICDFSDENSSYGGDLLFGNVDSSKYTGSIIYVPVVIDRYWEFQIDG